MNRLGKRSIVTGVVASILSGLALLAAPAAHASEPQPVLAWNFNDVDHPGRDWVGSVDLATVNDAVVVTRETGEGKDPVARASVLSLPGGESVDFLDGGSVATDLAAAGLPTSGAMTITLWVWVRNPGSLVSWGGSGGSYTFAISDNGLNVVEQWSGGSSHLHFTGTPGLGYGWSHLAVTVDSEAEVQRKVYYNASAVPWAMAGTPGWTASVETFAIGGNGPGGWGPVPFAGLIDDVRIYATALTQAQIETIMAETDEAKITATPAVTPPPAPMETVTADSTITVAAPRGVEAHTGDVEGLSALVLLGLLGLLSTAAYGLRQALGADALRPALLPLVAGLLAVRLLVWLWDLRLTWLPSRP